MQQPAGAPTSSEITGTIHSLGTATADSGPVGDVAAEEVGLVEPGTHVLLAVTGPAAGTKVELVGDRMTVGRSEDTEIFLDDITVSRQHAHFDHNDDGWMLVDLGSLNGSYVNRGRVDQVQLAHGDEIQIGKYRFRYVTGDPVELAE